MEKITSLYNKYDYFIIFIIVFLIVGTIQYGVLGYTLLAGLLCFPFAIKEINFSIQNGKFTHIILFLLLWLLYAILSIFWAGTNEYTLREIWNLFWHIIIFCGIYNVSRVANNPIEAIITGWCLLILLTLPVALWEITTGSHLPNFGDFNEGQGISGSSELRIFAAVTYKNLNTYVTLLCSSLPFLMLGILQSSNKILPTVTTFGSIVILIINSSRGGLLCLCICLIVFSVYFFKTPFPYKKFISIFIIIVGIFVISHYGADIAEQAIGRIQYYGKDNITQDPGRWDVWKMGVDFCIKSFGFGCGVGSMIPVYASTGFWLHYSHNFVIEFILQYGLWMFLPFGILLLRNWLYMCKADTKGYRMLGYSLMLSFIPWAIINDTYLSVPYVWIWLASQFVIGNHI